MEKLAKTIATVLPLLALGVNACAQESTAAATELPPAPGDELTLPPEIEGSPGEVRLEPAPGDREDVLEAVVTGGQSSWRLPDLGSSFRREEEERDPNQRFHVNFLPLYDPENQDPTENLFPSIEDLRRVGFIEVIRINFGKRSTE